MGKMCGAKEESGTNKKEGGGAQIRRTCGANKETARCKEEREKGREER
jgi:hypothetical protein